MAKYVSVTFDWEAKFSKKYTYECVALYKEDDILIVGNKQDMTVVKVVGMVEKPSFDCKRILGKLEVETEV